MIVNYGYRDGSGTYYITIDDDKCDGCGKCVEACTSNVLEIACSDFDPLVEKMMAVVTEVHRKKLRYSCASCKQSKLSDKARQMPCTLVCERMAISHSW